MVLSSNFEVPAKWKKVVLTVEEKLEIIELLHKNQLHSYRWNWQVDYHRYKEKQS